jgi:photosystem II stability/assembly factor-like uncharacterized protein
MYNSNVGLACAYLNGIYFSNKLSSSGTIWSFIPSNTSIITSAYITNYTISAEIFATTNDGSVIYSNNSGLSWSILYTLQNIFFSNIFFASRTFGVICGYTNCILITTNGGYTFTNSYPGYNAYYYQAIIGTSGIIYAVGSNQTIVSSNNYGVSWNLLNSNLGTITSNIQTFYGIAMYNYNLGYIVGEKGCILQTTNGGISWTYTNVSYNDLKSVTIIDISNAIVVGFGGTMFSTNNQGLSWFNMSSVSNQNINSITKYNNIVLAGGGINECLKEVELALYALNKNFNILNQYTY